MGIGTVLPHLTPKIPATAAQARADANCIYVEYTRTEEAYGYVAPRIKVDFGARSTDEPAEADGIGCDAAEYLPELLFRSTKARVTRVERTLWEKATAVHVFCLQGTVSERQARQWYDLAQLDVMGLAGGADQRARHRGAGERTQNVVLRSEGCTGTGPSLTKRPCVAD